jgi:hypothetical protein
VLPWRRKEFYETLHPGLPRRVFVATCDKTLSPAFVARLRLAALDDGTWAQWEQLLKGKIGIGKSCASELMQIADGRKTVEQVNERRAESMRQVRHRSSPSRDGETAGSSTSRATRSSTDATAGAPASCGRRWSRFTSISRERIRSRPFSGPVVPATDTNVPSPSPLAVRSANLPTCLLIKRKTCRFKALSRRPRGWRSWVKGGRRKLRQLAQFPKRRPPTFSAGRV